MTPHGIEPGQRWRCSRREVEVLEVTPGAIGASVRVLYLHTQRVGWMQVLNLETRYRRVESE